MTDRFILWAQALDDISPDHFDVHGKDLDPDDTVQRQAAVSSVSSVIKSGSRIFEQNGVLLTANAHHFVVEVSTAQRDPAGRIAPIVCYGDYDATVGDALGASAANALEDFAKRIGRTLAPEHFEIAQASFDSLKKKSLRTRLVRTVGSGAVGLVLLAIYWLAQKSW